MMAISGLIKHKNMLARDTDRSASNSTFISAVIEYRQPKYKPITIVPQSRHVWRIVTNGALELTTEATVQTTKKAAQIQ